MCHPSCQLLLSYLLLLFDILIENPANEYCILYLVPSGCQDVDRDSQPGSPGYNMAIVAHLAYLIRYVDFADTLFFILRKKFDNVSALQVSIGNAVWGGNLCYIIIYIYHVCN